MTPYEYGETTRQRLDIQIAMKTEGEGYVVIPTVRSKLVENTEALLSEGRGKNKLIRSFCAGPARHTFG